MNGKSYIFDEFRLELGEKLLLRNGMAVPLQPKAFDMLAYFAGRSGELVSHDELFSTLWPETFVGDSNIALGIHTLRKTLGKRPDGDSYLITLPKRGYRFNATVTTSESANGFDNVATIPAVESASVGFTGKSFSVNRLLIGVLVLFVIGLTVAMALWRNGNLQAPGNSPAPDRLAVLPFKAVNQADSNFELGLADAMITSLGKIKQIQVAPLQEVRGFAGADSDALALGQKLNARLALTGTYRIDGDTVRITAKLLNVTDGSAVWDETFSLQKPSRLEMEQAVAARIGRILSLELGQPSDEQLIKGENISAEAAENYLAGRKLWRADDIGRREEMTRYFEKTIELEPEWSRPYSALAEALIHGDRFATIWDRAEKNIYKALELDPKDEQAHAALGQIYLRKYWDWNNAEQSFRRAIEIDPNYADAHNQYAVLLRIERRFAGARSEIGMAIELDPFSPGYYSTLCDIEYSDHNYDKTLSDCRFVQSLTEDYWRAKKHVFWIYVQKNMYADMAELILSKLSPEDRQRHPLGSELNGSSIAKFWQYQVDRHLISIANPAPNSNPAYLSLATSYMQLGQYDSAIVYLEKALNPREESLPNIHSNPIFDPIRQDKRFVDIVAKIGLQK